MPFYEISKFSAKFFNKNLLLSTAYSQLYLADIINQLLIAKFNVRATIAGFFILIEKVSLFVRVRLYVPNIC